MKEPLHTLQPDAIVARLNELDVEKVAVVKVDNIKQMTNEQIDNLRCGDIVTKKTGNQYHAYVVTFKSDTGICLSYFDASVIETQSYDKVGDNWVYNSEDKTPNLLNINKLEDIVDAQGNKRFVEGDITAEEITGVTQTYGKYSLSGTHLMAVVCLTAVTGTTVNGKIADVTLPTYIASKIVPVFRQYITRKTIEWFDENGNIQSQSFYISISDNVLTITGGSLTISTADKSIRIAFDLLIDNE